MANSDFKAKVLKTLKGGDEVVVDQVLDTAEKLWKKEVTNAKKLLATLKEKNDEILETLRQDKEEAESDFDASFLNLTLDAKVREQRESFIRGQYANQIEKAYKKVKAYSKQIEQEEENYTKEEERLEEIISNYTLFLSKIGVTI